MKLFITYRNTIRYSKIVFFCIFNAKNNNQSLKDELKKLSGLQLCFGNKTKYTEKRKNLLKLCIFEQKSNQHSLLNLFI